MRRESATTRGKLPFSSLQPMIEQRVLTARRLRNLRALEKRRGSRVISLIHRRESFSFLGIPFGGFIDIEDSEAVIRAIEMTGKDVPIDLVLHTPGGLVLAADQIVLAPSAVLGPVDPQRGEYAAASILAAVERKDVNETDDKTLILADVSRKAQAQVRDFVTELLKRQMPATKAEELATTLSDGRWTHDFPINVTHAQSLGLKVTTDLPVEVFTMMSLCPQPRCRRPSVEYVPVPYRPERSERGSRHIPGSRR